MLFNPDEDQKDVNSNPQGDAWLLPLVAKTAAITFTSVALLALIVLSLLIIASPFGAMQKYYKLGLYEASLSSAENYLRGERRERGITESYQIFSHQDLMNTQFLTAETTAITVSETLMTDALNRGNINRAKKFAASLELYTREYLSVYGITSFNDDKTAEDMSRFADIQLKSYVSNYTRTLQTLNYKARCVTGDVNAMLYNNSISSSGTTDIVTQTLTQATTFGALTEDSLNNSNVGNYITYISQLTEYVYYENARLYGGDVPSTEGDVPKKLAARRSSLSGNMYYTLLLNKGAAGTFTQVYNGLNSYRRYMNYVVEKLPDNTVADAANKLYAVRTLSEFCKQMNIMLFTVYQLSSAQYSAENLYTHVDAGNIQKEIIFYEYVTEDGNKIYDSRWEGNQVYDYQGDTPMYLDSLYVNLLREYREKFQ